MFKVLGFVFWIMSATRSRLWPLYGAYLVFECALTSLVTMFFLSYVRWPKFFVMA